MKRKRETTQKRGEKAHKEITRQHDRDICQRWCLEYCADTIQQVDPGMLIFFLEDEGEWLIRFVQLISEIVMTGAYGSCT